MNNQMGSFMAVAPASVGELRSWLGRYGQAGRPAAGVLPFGLDAIDGRLPGGGLDRGALHEVIEGGAAGEFAAQATLFVGGILARTAGPVLWCLRSRDLFAPALARVGLHPDRVIYCETWRDRDVLPAMEEGLRCAGLAAVVGEATRVSLTASRRLQLCAGEHGVTAILLRRWRTAGERGLAGEANAASTRWRIAPAAAAAAGELDRPLWQVDLLRARGGEAHSWTVEACDAQGHLALPAALAVRPAAAEARRRAAAG